MINISQEEFENKIREIIKGIKSRTDMSKELETDSRTLNNKIQELSVYNPDLYIEFIKKFPFKQKERDDIDFEALIAEIMKEQLTMKEAAERYEIGERTIRRRSKEIEKTNPELSEIYSEYKYNNKHGIRNNQELDKKIEELVLSPVRISEINASRRKKLEDIEKIFNARSMHVTKEDAARSMGMTMNRVYKLLNELYRMRIEEEHKQGNRFRNALKVEVDNIQPSIPNIPTTNNKSKQPDFKGE